MVNEIESSTVEQMLIIIVTPHVTFIYSIMTGFLVIIKIMF